MNFKYLFFFIICAVIGWGCAHTAQKKQLEETEAIYQDVTGTLAGQNISREKFRELVKDIQTNQESNAAVEAIKGALETQNFDVKYCPIDGEHFSAKLNTCPKHHVPLKNITQ